MDTVPQDHRTCTACGQVLPLESFYIKIRATGRRFARCKPCLNAANLAYYNASTGRRDHEDRRRRKKPPQVDKRCTRCGALKPCSAFSARGDQSNRLRSACTECRRVEKSAYTAAHKARIRARDAVYRAAHAAEVADRLRLWRAAHPNDYSAIHRRSKHKRRMQIRQNGGHWTTAEWQALKATQGYRCLLCNRCEPEIDLTFDHIVPLSCGGTNAIGNGQGLCRSCNSKKHRKTLDLRH